MLTACTLAVLVAALCGSGPKIGSAIASAPTLWRDVNLSVDLQESWRLAAAVAPHVDKIRYNPGHLYHHEREKSWREKVRYIPYWVDSTQFSGADPAAAPPDFLAVGRFVEKKAPHLTLLAFSQILSQVPTARLNFIGAIVDHVPLI